MNLYRHTGCRQKIIFGTYSTTSVIEISRCRFKQINDKISYGSVNNQVIIHERKEPNINDQKGYGNVNNKVTVHERKEPNIQDQISYSNMNNQMTFTQEVHEEEEPDINDQISYANMNSQVTVHEGKELNIYDQISYANMNSQVKVHEGKEPNINDQISYGNMNNQVTKKGNPMRYACEECQEDWNSMNDLKKHLKENHPGVKGELKIKVAHGKTTITSLIACILEDAGIDPTIINGGIINGIDANAKLGNGEWIVAEADESDGSFIIELKLKH